MIINYKLNIQLPFKTALLTRTTRMEINANA
jgi:hypothetical protein